ncbi:type I restriction-modification enzyme S subunit [Calothrix sp. NIES-2100]|uniref:restriction endonuclease subunit S n=1 Tax=Calothrix sp. NIES-2100 TaxID=1954172 RepID=UPI000B615D04|nr:type I restriction-modification enzyme S subunit [Calothrix sp. NIES-2100]
MIITTIPLRKIAKQVLRTIDVLPGTSYRTIGVKWWGEGAYERETIDGSQTAAKTLSIVREYDLIINKIWVRHGSIAIAGKDVDGCAASGEFPTFELDLNEVLPRWLHWYTKTREFWDKCAQLSQGTSGKNRIKPDLFLTVEIPLPPLEEQRRVVDRVEELVGKIEEVRSLRQQALKEVEALMGAEEVKIWTDESLKNAPTLQDVTTYLSRGRQSKQGESNHYLIKTQHVQMGKYVKPQITLAPDIAAKVSPEAIARHGDILIACSAAGCLGRVAYYTASEIVASTDTHIAIARANREIILAEYLYAYLKGFQGQVQLRSREKGDWTREKVGFRLTELNVADMRRIPIPLPPLPEQRRIVAYLDELQTKLDTMQQLREQAMKELDALLPSILDKAFKGEL